MNEEPTSKKEDEIYCPECGKAIKRNAVICVNCGVQIKELLTRTEIPEKITTSKSKTTAIVLSIFFSFWSWLYTYRRNFKKFWVSFGIIAFFWISIFIYTTIQISSGNEKSVILNGYFTWYWLAFLVCFWVWAIIDNATKSNSFYDNYPND